jgi:hypothetical protein
VFLVSRPCCLGGFAQHNGRMVKYQARALFGFALVLMLTCIITSGVVLSKVYIEKGGIKGVVPDSVYPVRGGALAASRRSDLFICLRIQD